MKSTRRYSKHLFPSNRSGTAYVVHGAVTESCGPLAAITYDSYYDGTAVTSTKTYEGNADLTVTPEGFLFHKKPVQRIFSLDDGRPPVDELYTSLSYVHAEMFADAYVDNFIDPSMITMLSANTCCGVNNDHNELYSYRFYASLNNINIEHGKSSQGTIGTSIYKAEPGEKITAFAGCPDSAYGDGCLVIGLDTGSIIITGTVKDRKFEIHATLSDGIKYDDLVPSMFTASRDGKVVLHFPEQNMFRVFDLNTPVNAAGTIRFEEVRTDKPLYDLKLSMDGAYLYGKQFKGGLQTDTAYVYDMKTLTAKKIKLSEAVMDFVIGGENKVAVIKDESKDTEDSRYMYVLGSVNELMNYGGRPVPVRHVTESTPLSLYGLWGSFMSTVNQYTNVFNRTEEDNRSDYRP